jgi:hypothetical protein
MPICPLLEATIERALSNHLVRKKVKEGMMKEGRDKGMKG